MHRRHTHPSSPGFTLIEASLAIVIVGTGVLAIIAAQQAYLRKNMWAQRSGTAVLLANEVRELTLTLPLNDSFEPANMGPEAGEGRVETAGVGRYTFDDLDDFAGVIDAGGFGAGTTFDPPIDAFQQEVADMDGWSQLVHVANVLPQNIGASGDQPLGTTDLMRVTVTVRFQEPGAGEPITMSQMSWVLAN